MNTLTFTIPELKSILSGLAKIIPRHTLPILQHIQILRDKNSIVTLQAMDLNCSATFRFPQPIDGPPMNFLVPFEPLSRILRGAKGQVNLIPDKESVIVRTFIGQTPIDKRLDTKPAYEWPPLPSISALPILVSAAAIKAIREAMDFASEDETRLTINSVCVDASNKDAHYIVGTNGRALYSANSFKFAMRETVSIPTHKFWTWPGLPIEDCTFTVQPPPEKEEVGWISFQFKDWTFITKQQVGNYPNWRQVVPKDFNVSLEFNEEAAATVLQAVPQLPGGEDKDKPVGLRFSDNQVFVENGGSSIPITGVSVSGKPMSIRLNRDYLLLCFKLGLTTIQLIDDLSPLLFTKDGKRAVVMPLRAENAVSSPAPAANAEPESEVEPTPEAPTEPPTETPPAPIEPPTNETPEPMPTTTKPVETITPEPAVKEVLKRLDELKEDLKQVLRDLQEAYTLVKQVEKEKKASDKEIESIREKLRDIQNVKI